MTHTPGPWRIEYTGAFPMIVSRDGGKFDGSCICTEVCNGDANARLIAAAPDLMEACEPDLLEYVANALEEMDLLGVNGFVMALRGKAIKERAAIAKAEGRE